MGDKSKLSEDDIQLFRKTVGDVKPVNNDRIDSAGTPKPEAIPLQLQQDEAKAVEDMMSSHYDLSELERAESISFHRPGIQLSVLRKLKRGQYSIEARFDLHGLNAKQAYTTITLFLTNMRTENKQCVLIIHGKGKRSNNEGPVLKPLVAKWLSQRDDVLAYCSARPSDGGNGAVYILLRKH